MSQEQRYLAHLSGEVGTIICFRAIFKVSEFLPSTLYILKSINFYIKRIICTYNKIHLNRVYFIVSNLSTLLRTYGFGGDKVGQMRVGK